MSARMRLTTPEFVTVLVVVLACVVRAALTFEPWIPHH